MFVSTPCTRGEPTPARAAAGSTGSTGLTGLDPRVGTVLDGRYRVVQRIAAGTMGVIYRGERVQLGRAVAIKFLRGPDNKLDEFRHRFELEARALAQLEHPNCVSIVDFGLADVPYLVMDFVSGETLRELMDRARLPAPRAIHICRQVLAALAHAHRQGITHRDIKPGNIVLREVTGAGDHIRVLDFGLAKLHNAAVGAASTTGKRVLGTPAYIPPEQVRGEQIDARCDVYSTAVVLFEMLSGEKPFVSDDSFELLKMHVHRKPPTLNEVDPTREHSAALESVLARALRKDPADRFQSAMEFAEALAATPEARRPLHGPLEGAQPGLEETARSRPAPPRRMPRAAWLLAAIGGAAVLLGTVAAYLLH